MSGTADTLGEFLRAKREQIRPEDVGLSAGSRRRVAGLRREEVALLAGISSDYYLRLEQGRDLNPSDQILSALAGALRLDDDATGYLHRLAHPEPRRKRRRNRVTSGAALQALMDNWLTTPAYAQDSAGRVTAANGLAAALCPHFAVGQNPLRALFLEPEMQRLYVNWQDTTVKAVSGLRAMLSPDTADAELLELIGELSVASDRFRTLWARRDVRSRPSGLTEFSHPLAGRLSLHYEKLQQSESRQVLVVYRAEPGSETFERLQMLASL